MQKKKTGTVSASAETSCCSYIGGNAQTADIDLASVPTNWGKSVQTSANNIL